MFRKSPVQAKGGQRELHRSLHGQRALTSLSFKAFPLPLQSNPGTTDLLWMCRVRKSILLLPLEWCVRLCLFKERQSMVLKEHLSAWPSSLRWMIVCSITGGPTQEGVVTATWCLLCSSRKGVKRARRESTLMSVIIVKEETESHLLGWSTQAMPKEHSFLFSCFISTVSAGLKQSLLCLT